MLTVIAYFLLLVSPVLLPLVVMLFHSLIGFVERRPNAEWLSAENRARGGGGVKAC